jgi:carbon monoxide dehydrogenase subunit G
MEWTGARYADTPTVEAETWIDAAPDHVWAVVSDIEVMPALSTELQSVAWRDGTGPAVGNTFVGRNRHDAMGEWETTSRIVECEPPRVFAWAVQGIDDDVSSSWRYTLEPAGGGTRLRQWMRMGPGRAGLSFAIERMPDKEQKIVFVRMRELENSIIGTLAAIKERAEGVRPAGA